MVRLKEAAMLGLWLVLVSIVVGEAVQQTTVVPSSADTGSSGDGATSTLLQTPPSTPLGAGTSSPGPTTVANSSQDVTEHSYPPSTQDSRDTASHKPNQNTVNGSDDKASSNTANTTDASGTRQNNDTASKNTDKQTSDQTTNEPPTQRVSNDKTNEATDQATDPSTQPAQSTSEPESSGAGNNTRMGVGQRLRPVLEKLAQFIPGSGFLIPAIDQAVTRLDGLSDDQLRMLAGFIQLVESSVKMLPANVQGNVTDLLQAVERTGLFDLLSSAQADTVNITQQGSGNQQSLLPPHTESWSLCQLNILTMLRGLNNTESWALEMVDSMGKPGRSILKGHIAWLGNNEQCTDVVYRHGASLSNFRGKTCRTALTVSFLGSAISLFGGPPPPIVVDVCLPDTCDSSDLNLAMWERGITNVYFTCTADLDMSGDVGAYFTIILLVIFGLLLVVGSLLDVCLSFESSGKSSSKRSANYVINAYTSSSQAQGNINPGFELKEIDTSKLASIEVPLSNGGSQNGVNNVLTKRANGVKSEPTSPSYADYRTPSSVLEEMAVAPPVTSETKADAQKAPQPQWQKLLLAFSIQRNSAKIFSVETTPATIGCLHGVRVLSLAWVILGHTMLFGALFYNFENPKDVYERVFTMPFQIIVNGPLSVDTFYFMSGFLVCYLFLKECAKRKGVSVKGMVLYYIHRYWRLTPPYAVWILLEACLLQYVGEGRPGWTDNPGAAACRENWWANLVYINSVYTDGGVCCGVSWFLANDMMFYVIAPLVMIPWVYRQRVAGFFMAAILLGIHLGSNIWLISKYNFDLVRQGSEPTYSDTVYFKPYTRVGPFAVGLVCGWILHTAKGKLTMNKLTVCAGWLLALGTIFTVSLVTYDENGDPEYFAEGWTAGGKAAYESLARPLWAAAMGWVVLACASGYGGFINSILSWPGWQPLSRLTYCAYLVHLTIINITMMAPEDTYLFTDTGFIMVFVAYYFLSYSTAYVLAISVEAPMLGLEKALLK